MVTLHDWSTGEDHQGQSPESIARRVWGRRATMEYGERIGGVRTAMVTEPVASSDILLPRRVLAHVMVYQN